MIAKHHRCGFTLIELLVVVAIIGILVVLIVPGVQSAREAARRTQCQNNLRQMGMALNDYVTRVEAFPIGYIAWPNPLGGAAPGWAWSAAILPVLEQTAVFNAINVNLPTDAAANSTARTTIVATYVCPSNRNTGSFSITSQLTGGLVEVQTTSFAANGGTVGSNPFNGMFRMNQPVRLKDVKRGLSNTFAVGERGCFVVQNAWAGALGDGRGGVQVLATVSPIRPASRNSAGFGGPHPGVTQFVMADGSARSIKATINVVVSRALATRDGREVVDPRAY